MSQSPAENKKSESYSDGWRSLSAQIRAGASFSGNERNTVFLNLGGASFADISAASGLDFADDTRAVVSCDWDFDGKVDFWTSNRTAPRVRFLKNGSTEGSGFVAFRLQGTKSNRDAIGARVEISADGKEQAKSVMAGDGFLSQSSRWQRFGVGRAKEVEVLVVWPGGLKEKFGNVRTGGFFELKEGSGKPVAWTPPQVKLSETAYPQVEAEKFSRVLMVGRIPLLAAPKVEPKKGEVTLIRVWSKDCLACERQGLDLGRSQSQIYLEKAALLSVNVDDFLEGEEKARSGFLESIEVFRDAFIESRRPLELPLHLLIDKSGNLAAFYQGEVPFKVIHDDLRALSEDVQTQREQAVPFEGRWASVPFSRQFLRYAEGFSKAGMPEKKEAYLKQIRDGKKAMAEVNRELGRDFLRLKQPVRSRDHFLAALPFFQGDAQLHFNLGLAETGVENYEMAVNHFKVAGSAAPERPEVFFRMGYALHASGASKEALAAYRQALRLRPSWPAAANNLSWILSTHPDETLRDGTDALRIAQMLMKNEGSENPTALLTLAAAFAEVGNFKSAIQVVDRALAIAHEDQVEAVVKKLTAIRADFEEGKPIRGK